MEPELGNGVVVAIEGRQVELRFGEIKRRYAIENAPISRAPVDGKPLSIEDSIFSAQFDLPEAGQLRVESLYARYHHERSMAKGWVGPRVQLISHQINTASMVVSLFPGRFWLADEVGLGKTITAGLVLHHLLQTERVERVLVLVPDALLIQWFIELYRKFNLAFSLINDYFKESSPSDEFWASHDLCLSSYEFIAASPSLQTSLLANNWDLLIMDEAHHLPHFPLYSEVYLPLIAKAKSPIFLSASVDPLPSEMLGATGHIFRSTRAQIPMFPKRQAYLIPLLASDDDSDPLVDWLLGFLAECFTEKVLLIVHTAAQAQTLQSTLRQRASLNTALFHEGMTLVARDRMAAYFADNDDVRLLICSEIGSEGRNFQFCHHLVFFDYPRDIGLLEQRIGRIDRIGQTSIIHLHMPFIENSPEAQWVRWLNESVGLFDAPLSGGTISAQTIIDNKRLLSAIVQYDESTSLVSWIETLMEHFNVEVEDLAPNTVKFITDHSLFDALSGSDDVRPPFTYSRSMALRREDYHFLTWDHPMTQNAMMLLLASKDGVCSAAYWPDKTLSRPTLYLETVYVAGDVPLRITLNERGECQRIPLTTFRKVLQKGSPEMFRTLVSTQKPLLQKLLKRSGDHAETTFGMKPTLEGVRLIIRG